MALPATDNFNAGSQGQQLTTYSSNWTLNNGGFDMQPVSGNECATDALSENMAHWNADTFSNDQYAAATASSVVSSSRGCGVAVRCAAAAHTGYAYYSTGANKYLLKFVTGSKTVLASSANPWSSSDTVRLEANGTTITPILNGSTDSDLGAQTDSSIASGSAGVSGLNDRIDARIDDWEGGDLGGGGGISVPVAYFHLRQQGIA